jgi:rhomboid protease GluP
MDFGEPSAKYRVTQMPDAEKLPSTLENPGSSAGTFCARLANQFIAERDFQIAKIPEAMGLIAASDTVLTLSDGLSFTVLCMVDREAHPGKVFALSVDEVVAIGTTCLKYGEKTDGTRLPVSIMILEAGPGSTEQRPRLKQFKRPSVLSEVRPSAMVADTTTAQVWYNHFSIGRTSYPEFIQKFLSASRKANSDPVPAAEVISEPAVPAVPSEAVADPLPSTLVTSEPSIAATPPKAAPDPVPATVVTSEPSAAAAPPEAIPNPVSAAVISSEAAAAATPPEAAPNLVPATAVTSEPAATVTPPEAAPNLAPAAVATSEAAAAALAEAVSDPAPTAIVTSEQTAPAPPPQTASDPVPATAVASKQVFPILTMAILAALIGIFAAEIAYGIGPWTELLQPTMTTLVTFGGLVRTGVLQYGEWYRLFAAPFLHADAVHLAANAAGLLIAGRRLESLVGRGWFGTIYAVGALSGSLASLALNPEATVSVGASGAIMGSAAAMLIISLHFPAGATRTGLWLNAIFALTLSILPLASALQGHSVDYPVYLGGALGGAAVGSALLATWSRVDPWPKFAGIATAFALAGVLTLAYPVKVVLLRYPAVAFSSQLIPTEKFPRFGLSSTQTLDLIAHYPRDPRAHLMRASEFLAAHDMAGVEREARAGLAEENVWHSILPAVVATNLRVALAIALADSRRPEAIAVAQPVCSSMKEGPQRGLLDARKLCEI